MKTKIKTWILQMEGWRIYFNFFYKKGVAIKRYPKRQYKNSDYTGTHSLDEAWNSQFSNWKLILRTNLFWLIFTIVLACIFAACSENGILHGPKWCEYAAMICGIYPLGWTVYGIGYMLVNWIKKLFKTSK